MVQPVLHAWRSAELLDFTEWMLDRTALACGEAMLDFKGGTELNNSASLALTCALADVTTI